MRDDGASACRSGAGLAMSFTRTKGARSFVALVLLALACAMQFGCSSAHPTIEFSKIPPAAQGGRERVEVISGRVSGARHGQKIVVYARSGPWWVQPWPDQPLLPIHWNATWSTPTHLGFEYAALLVEPGYSPPATMDVLPAPGGPIVAIQTVKGSGAIQVAPTVPLAFSGYTWNVRTISGDRGGLNNLYDADNAWTDASGALHLRIKKRAGKWSCAELEIERSLGYGTYIATVRDTSQLEPAAILSMLTFDDWAGEQHYREMDVEMSRWGDGASKNNAQFTVQPFYVPGNVAPFSEPAGTLTHSLHWESGRATFRTVKGPDMRPGAPLVAEHVFTNDIASPGKERLLLMFYVVGSEKYPMQNESEMVIEKFEYLP
jgi:hypothetical protein